MTEGEKLLLLVRRSGKESKVVAEAIGYNPIYFSRLYKKGVLPDKPKSKIIEYFNLPSEYFEEEVSQSEQLNSFEQDIAELKELLKTADTDRADIQAQLRKLAEVMERQSKIIDKLINEQDENG